jgi:hypothetical protein
MVPNVTDLSPDQAKAVQIAHNLIDAGVPLFSAPPHSSQEFARPDAWQDFRPNHVQVDRWRPGWALCLVTGVRLDVLDVDPRNGGTEGFTDLSIQRAVPRQYGHASTPSQGDHYLIRRTGLAKTSKAARGVDLQAGAPDGTGRGYIYIAPTVRVSKYGPREGQAVPYWWVEEPDLDLLLRHDRDGLVDDGLENLRAVVELNRGRRRPAARAQVVDGPVDEDIAAFADLAADWTVDSAKAAIRAQLDAVQEARAGDINNTLGGAARVLGRFVAGGFLDEDTATEMLLAALEVGGQHSDSWNAANGKGWTASTVIGAGLANGALEPWTVEQPEAPARPNMAGASVTDPSAKPGTVGVSDPGAPSTTTVPPAAPGQSPRMHISSAAALAYDLQNMLGTGRLSGYFLRGGQVVHTPHVDELGYVEPRADADDNGSVQIQPVTAAQLAAKIQYAFYCYKEVDEKDADGKKTGKKAEVPALFPLEAAKRATDAPEAMVMLRPLAGVTETPMVRRDGSILERPGYDQGTRFLFLPGQGVKVPAVPLEPTPDETRDAVALLDEMTAGFPWVAPEDRANYYGLLLTPLLRLVAPPSYKMFGITAHQPGSGKTLLADVARILHGGVLRSEMPADEAEVGKMTTSTLATTSAPIIHVDNVTGVLRSAKLAGLLTADGEIQERELGSHRNLTFTNDRVWVVTGNNLSLGGDLVRRTIVINIDPNMANPETRDFAIGDLKGWAASNRNRLLQALLVMIRTWVAAGRPLEPRRQSDSFAAWESTVGGILAACGVPGTFDDMSGRKAAAGGDDDGLGQVLERMWDSFGERAWNVGDALSDTRHTELGDMVAESRDWLPSSVLDKLARSEASGRKTFGHWLRNRLGRWVAGSDGHSYVLRQGGVDRTGAWWRIERSA